MSMDHQGPKAGASCTLQTEPAAFAKEAAATEPPPMPSIEPVVREQDRLLPVANVSRIMRRALPPHAKISDDAKEVIQDCVSEFISFITGEANERCHNEHRKTVTAEDIVWAMNHLGFDDYIGPLNAFLQRMRESEGGGAGHGSGRGSRRGSPLQLGALDGSAQMRPAPYRHPQPAAPQAYAAQRPVPHPDQASSAALPHSGGWYQMPSGLYQMPGGQHPMVPSYYGRAAFQAGRSNGGFYADEASSSSEAGSSSEAPPAPRAGPRRY